MRWLLAQILWVPKLIAGALFIAGLYHFFLQNNSDDWVIACLIFGPINILLFDWLQTRLLERRPRFPRVRLPKPPKTARRAPEAAPVAPTVPQAAAQRRFAPVPLSEAVEQRPAPPRPVMSPDMKRFVERGDRAINPPP